MKRPHRQSTVTFFFALALTYAQQAQANEYTGVDFLQMSAEQQNSYIEVSLSSITVLLTQTSKPELASCLDRWYFASRSLINQRNIELRGTIRRNSEFHPSAVLVSAIRSECGAYP